MKEKHGNLSGFGHSPDALRTVTDPAVLADVAAGVLGDGHTIAFRASGSSMRPFIRDGDVLTVVPTDPRDLRAGDIVYYAGRGSRPAAHRILRRAKRNGRTVFMTRGDASGGPCAAVEAHQVLGRVTAATRGGRTVRLDGRTRRWMALVLAGLQPLKRLLLTALASLRKKS